jgi:hypothetical protein
VDSRADTFVWRGRMRRWSPPRVDPRARAYEVRAPRPQYQVRVSSETGEKLTRFAKQRGITVAAALAMALRRIAP